jgi:hypothetical protein
MYTIKFLKHYAAIKKKLGGSLSVKIERGRGWGAGKRNGPNNVCTYE